MILGRVEDVIAFLEALETLRRENPQRLRHLSQIVPIEKNFSFTLSNFTDRLREIIAPYAEEIENNSTFYIRVRRRGHKGEISSLEVEHEMDTFILETLERAGKQARISFEEPDRIIIIETIENRAGIGLITREMKERYSFIRVK